MAIEITNKRSLCTVSNSTSTIKLEGELVSSQLKKISGFSGSFYRVDPVEYIGNFNYSETSDGRVSKSIGEIPSDLFETASNLFDATLDEIETTEI
jgi:hypothetical protein